MKSSLSRYLIAWIAKFLLLAAYMVSLGVNAAANTFKVFNAINYAGTPSLASYGIRSVKIFYESSLDDSPGILSRTRRYSKVKIDAAAASLLQSASQSLISLDMETWGWSHSAIEKYRDSLKEFRRVSGDKVRLGFYNVMPTASRDLYIGFAPPAGSASLSWTKSWLATWENRQVVGLPLLDEVDVLMPAFYTYGTNTVAWEKMVKKAVSWARQNAPGKPIYAYIWPQYYSQSVTKCSRQGVGGRFLPVEVWVSELNTLYRLVDGVIIWSPKTACTADGRLVNPSFDPKMPWFSATLNFMKIHGLDLVR